MNAKSHTSERRALGAAALFGMALLAMQLAWLLAVPPSYGIDEFDHAYRASSVAAGDWRPGSELAPDGRGVLLRVDPDIVEASFRACDDLDYTGPDNCSAVTQPDQDGLVLIASAAGTYNPVWYFVVGNVGEGFNGQDAILAMRIMGMIMCDLLLLAAAALICLRYQSSWPLVGLAAVCTPVVVYASVVVAPNGVQYAAGILMWVSILSLTSRDAQSAHAKASWLALALSASVVATVHTTGPLWVFLTASLAAPLLKSRMGFAWREERGLLLASAVTVIISSAASVLWVVYAGTNDPASDASPQGSFPLHLVAQGPLLWLFQSFATLRLRGDAAPMLAYSSLASVTLTLIGVGLWKAARRVRTVVGSILAMSVLVPLALTYVTYSQIGSAWQGRYGLPLTVGITLLAASQLHGHVTADRRLVCIAAIMLGVGHTATATAMFAEHLPGAVKPPIWGLWLLGLLFVGLMGKAFMLCSAAPDSPQARDELLMTGLPAE